MVWAPHDGRPKMDSVLSALLHPDPQGAKNPDPGTSGRRTQLISTCMQASRNDEKQQKHDLPVFLTFKSQVCFHDGLGTLVIKDSRKYVVFYLLSEAFRKAYYKGVEMELSECICNI